MSTRGTKKPPKIKTEIEIETSSPLNHQIKPLKLKMYRSVARRLLPYSSSLCSRISISSPPFRLISTDQTANGFNNTTQGDAFHNPSDSGASRRTTPRANYEEEQARVLAASLHHVVRRYTILFYSLFPFDLQI